MPASSWAYVRHEGPIGRHPYPIILTRREACKRKPQELPKASGGAAPWSAAQCGTQRLPRDSRSWGFPGLCRGPSEALLLAHALSTTSMCQRGEHSEASFVPGADPHRVFSAAVAST